MHNNTFLLMNQLKMLMFKHLQVNMEKHNNLNVIIEYFKIYVL